jgi:hypothetical protein
MTKRRFGKRRALAASFAAVTMTLAVSASAAQQAEPPMQAGKPIHAGDILSGELMMMEVRDAKEGKRVPTYQITSEPRRLPQPGGLCNLETGPETFQLITSSNAQTAQLKALVGKAISVKIGEVACAEDASQISEAVVTKWSLVKQR